MRKRILLIAVAFLVAAAMAMAGGTGEKAGTAAKKSGGFVVGLTNFSIGNSWRVQMEAEAKYYASQHTDQVKQLIITEANDSVSKQISDIEDLITKKVDAIVITAADPKAVVPAVNEAMKAGIVVVDFDNNVGTDNTTAHILVDEKQWGAIGGAWLAKKLNGKGNIVIFNGMKGTQAGADRYNGAMSELGKYPDIKILTEVYADWDYAKGKRAEADVLSAYPHIDGYWSQGGAMSQAILDTYFERNLNNPPPVTGEDSNGFLKLWKKLKDQGTGFDSIALSMPTWCVAKAMEVAIDALSGKSFDKNTVIPVPTITAATLDQYVKPDLPDSYWCNSQLPADIAKQLFTR